MNAFAVTLRADGGGTATVLCRQLTDDPMFPGKVVLVGVLGLSIPVAELYQHIDQWSVDKSLVVAWKVGALRMTPELDFEGLVNREKPIPVLAGATPSQLLLSHPEELKEEEAPLIPSVEAPPTPKPSRKRS